MRTTYLRITFLFCFLLSIEGTISAQKFDWHGFYDVEENELAYILDIELDKQGNIYTSGGFTKTDFDIGPGVVARTANYGMDYFVTKYDSMGNWIWTITRGPNYILDDYITNIVIDEQNNIYAVGRDDDNFHDDSEFVLKLNSTGAVIWRKDFFIPDGMFQDAPVYFNDIKLDKNNDLVITGTLTGQTDMDPGAGTNLYAPTGLNDLLLFKMNSQGQVQWVKTMGSNDDNINSYFSGYYFDIDTSNQIWLSGYYNKKVDFDPGTGEFYLESPAQKNPFIAKYDENGEFQWAKQATIFNQNHDNIGGKIFIKKTGEVYWTFPYHGEIYDPELLSDTLFTGLTYASPLLKLNPDGSIDTIFKIGTRAGVYNYHIYPDGEILVIGWVEEEGDIDHSHEGVAIRTSVAQGSAPYMINYDAEGKFLWSRTLQKGSNTSLGFMDADDRGNVYLASTFCCLMNLVGEEDNPIPLYDIEGSQTVTSFLMKYKSLDCTGLEVEYITPDDQYYDQGAEPNLLNIPFWKSPSLRNTSRPGFYLSYNLDYDASFRDNYVHITVRSEGCNTVSNSKVALYYAIGDEGLQLPGPWEAQYANIAGQNVQISGKFGELDIPPLYKNESWQAAILFDVPVDPELFPEKAYSINLFGRIESPLDPDANIPSQNILEQVANNNNISWRVFQVRP